MWDGVNKKLLRNSAGCKEVSCLSKVQLLFYWKNPELTRISTAFCTGHSTVLVSTVLNTSVCTCISSVCLLYHMTCFERVYWKNHTTYFTWQHASHISIYLCLWGNLSSRWWWLDQSNHASRLPAKHIIMFSISLTINITNTGKSAWYEIFSPHHDGIMMVWYTQHHTENDLSFTFQVIMNLVKVRQHDTNHRW